MAHKTIEGEASADWVVNFLETKASLSFGGGRKSGDQFMSTGIFPRTAYEFNIPWGWWKTALLGEGGDPEPIIMERGPSGKVELDASERMLRFIDRELENIRDRI